MRTANLCGVNALEMSLRAARTLNEGYAFEDVTAEDIMEILSNHDRWTAACEARLATYATEFPKDLYEEQRRMYSHQDLLEWSQITLLLDLINEDWHLNYRLGYVENGTSVLEGDNGPILWLFRCRKLNAESGHRGHVSKSINYLDDCRMKGFSR